MLVSFFRTNGGKTESIGSLLNLSQQDQDYYKANNAKVLNEGVIKSVDNPVEMRVGDQLKVTFTKMKVQWLTLKIPETENPSVRGGQKRKTQISYI